MRGAEEASFDPRTWTARAEAPAAAAPAPVKAASRGSSPSLRFLPQGAAVLLLFGGGVAAWMAREPVQPAPIIETGGTETEAPAPLPAGLSSRTLKLPGPAVLAQALRQSGIADADAVAAALLPALAGRTGEIRAVLRLDANAAAPQLVRLEVSFEDSSGAVLTRAADGSLEVAPVAAALNRVVTRLAGELDSNSFYSSAVAAGVPDMLIADIARAFVFDFDFQREIAPGDTFEVVYEQQRNAAGEAVGVPRLLFASLTTEEKSRSLYWFQPPDEEGGWFDGNGGSVIRSFMRTPVDGARVSSQFGYRIHPIQGYRKLHRGTDFAARTGTPIYASADGAVQSASYAGGAGQMVVLRHDNGWQTRYMHMSRFEAGVTPGVRVRQGQQIGDVGSTGASTGPHLHYEVLIEGEQVDPMSIQTESGKTLAGPARDAFLRERDRVDVARAARSDPA
jgi:murein DD-endopeptidase MepM/ murein hydrolase activator NlpD